MPTVDVVYEHVRGWHKFTSPHVFGLYIIVGPDQYWMAREDLPAAIEELIAANFRKKVTARAVESPRDERPNVLRFELDRIPATSKGTP